jgi:hypothetical protein
VTSAPKNKLSPHSQALYEAADAQRKLCRDWLLYIMSAFDVAWTWAIEETVNPLPRSRK